MKRSEVNTIIKESIAFFKEMQFSLPPFAHFTAEDWQETTDSCREILDLELGWDITDFGHGDFYQEGLLLFTIRNGSANSEKYPKSYAEKIMIVREKQYTPLHYHWSKMEDIINRGGGNLAFEFFNAEKDNSLSDTEVTLSFDGIQRTLRAGELVMLSPGESVTIPQGVYHRFCAETGKGWVLTGEISTINDDASDNHFFEPGPRFPDIEEDEAPYRLIGSDYAQFR